MHFIEKALKLKSAVIVAIQDFKMIGCLAPNLQVGFVKLKLQSQTLNCHSLFCFIESLEYSKLCTNVYQMGCPESLFEVENLCHLASYTDFFHYPTPPLIIITYSITSSCTKDLGRKTIEEE